MTQQRMWGADADALEALARDMQNASNRLDSISRQLTARLMSSAWDGGDADRFRADWNRKYRGQLRGSVEFLRQAQGHLSASSASQRGASADDGGRLGGVSLTVLGGMVGGSIGAWEAANDWRLVIPDSDWTWELLSEIFPHAVDMADVADVFSGGAGQALGIAGGAFSMFTGWLDLMYDNPFEGSFGTIEKAGDVLKIAGGALGIVGLVAAGVLAAPAAGAIAAPAAVAIGLGFMATGVGLGIDMTLDAWDEWGRDGVQEIGTWAAPRIEAAAAEIDETWDLVYEAGRDTADAIVNEAVGAVGRAVDGAQAFAGDVWANATGGGRGDAGTWVP